MSWASKALAKHKEEERIKRGVDAMLKELEKDDRYQELYNQIFEDCSDIIGQQYITMLFSCFCVAMKREGISDKKIKLIMCLTDELTKLDMTEPEYVEWCAEETGIKIGGGVFSE